MAFVRLIQFHSANPNMPQRICFLKIIWTMPSGKFGTSSLQSYPKGSCGPCIGLGVFYGRGGGDLGHMGVPSTLYCKVLEQ